MDLRIKELLKNLVILQCLMLCFFFTAEEASSFSLPATSITSDGRSFKAKHGTTSGWASSIQLAESKPSPSPGATEMGTTSTLSNDLATLSGHLVFCTLFAFTLTIYEGYDCAYLKPESATIRNYPSDYSNIQTNTFQSGPTRDIIQLMNKSTRGMGRGLQDREERWYEDTYYTSRDYPRLTSNKRGMEGMERGEYGEGLVAMKEQTFQDSARSLPSYNEIMLQHRTARVPSWKSQQPVTQEEFEEAVEYVILALESVQQLKMDAENYEWDRMLDTLRKPTLTANLQSGCSTLQRAKEFLSTEARKEVGFDWGSCAWRHCGAQADAEESLAQLYNSVGLFEPFECLFALDIVERSIRDILTVIPENLKPVDLVERVGTYQVYKVYPPEFDEMGELLFQDDDDMDAIDKEYLDALAQFSDELGSFDDEEED